jgi:hypothetical protein
MTSKIDEQVEFANSANSALLIICGRLFQDMRTISKLSVWNPVNTIRIRRIAREALDRRTVQLRKGWPVPRSVALN